ncbi:kinase-like protein, partial [Backusella circina FSU 941]
MQQVNGVPVHSSDPTLLYDGLMEEPTWFSAQGGVYRCKDRTTQEQVAIKKYLVEEGHHPDMFVMPKELVENEIYTMTKCVQPNILKLRAVHLHEEFVYLIMPLCTGGSLQQYVFEHHLTIGQLVLIIHSIASGLAKIHSHGYIHRDIKCDNIFLDQENNNIVIGDFGVVSISPAADSSVEEAGVVLFWSPELVLQKIVNHKVDIWALGIVILEVLNGGKAPYEDEKLEEDEIKERILENGKPAYPPGLPSRLIDLLDRCLDPEPKTRWSANAILQHPFLNDYEPELLFPATRLDQEISSQSDSEPSDMQQDDTTIVEAPSTKTVTIDTTQDQVVPSACSPPLSPQQQQEESLEEYNHHAKSPTPHKCRLPVPSFSVDKRIAAAVPVKEKILNVARKRQSLSATNRSQGSRLPMLSMLPIVTEPLKETTPRLRSVKSVRLRSPLKIETDAEPTKRRGLTRSNTMPLGMGSNKKAVKSAPNTPVTPKRISPSKSKAQPPINKAKPTAPAHHNTTTATTTTINNTNKKQLPVKSSIYRHKRLPGESRTARLMMGISTAGRRQSYKTRESEPLLPTLGRLKDKKRPISYAEQQQQQQQQQPTRTIPLPTPDSSKSKRQSVPI